MNYKKAGIVLTACALSTSLFAGCGKSNDSAKADDKKPSTNVSADAPGWKLNTDPITFDWYVNFSWFATKWGKDPTSQYITDKTGVSLNFMTPSGNEAEKMNTMIASGKLPDFLTVGSWETGLIDKMVDGGLLSSVDELAEKYDPYFFKISDKDKLNWFANDDGHTYGYPNSSVSPNDFKEYQDRLVSNQTFVVRKDMYEAIGSPDMRTPEGFLNALRAAKEKFPEVSGQPMLPIGLHEFTDTGNYSLERYLQNYLAIPREKDGQLYDMSTDPEYIKWLKVFRQATEEGLLAKDVFVDKRSQMEEKIGQGRYFAMMYQRSDFGAQEGALYQKDPNSVYIAVDGPANANLDQPRLDADGINGWCLTLISKDVKDPERAIQFLTYLTSEEGQKDVYCGPEGLAWDDVDGKVQWKEEALELANTDRNKFDQEYGALSTFWMQQDTAKFLEWAPPSKEPFKQLEDYTRGKTVDNSAYTQLDPPGDSKLGAKGTKIGQEWGKTLPKLLMAKSDAEFDKIYNAYLSKREDLGFAELQQYQEEQFQENKTKLGLE